MAETEIVRETITVVPVTGAIYHNGQEKPTGRWSFALGLNRERLRNQGQMHRLNITKFKHQASAKDFAPILPEWPKGRIFSIGSQ